ncbi:MAG: DUF2834 domain-containing protein [Cyanothece sp. SIO1E1]|nr:DUF2834 domain-containing protein [Cyanothece sp. SIO1E1]
MLRYLYLVLCLIGTILPYSQFVPFLSEHGLDVSLLLQQLFQNRISSFFGLDVIISTLVLWVFIFTEGPRQGMKNLWIYLACSLTVGVSLALPLFLYVRELKMPSDAGDTSDRQQPA